MGEHYPSGVWAADGTLGEQQTITIAPQSSGDYRYTITYNCGSVDGTVVNKTSKTRVSWTPPLAFAEASTTKDYVYATLTLTTYLGNEEIGTHYWEVLYRIPESVAPDFTIDIKDDSEYKEKYGEYIQNKSILRITVNPKEAYGAPIRFYKISANGEVFTKEEAVTNVLSSAGSNNISVSVTDSRGRKTEKVFNITVKAYTPPNITLTAIRCTEDGTANDQGEYAQIKFSVTADSITNTVAYALRYKESYAEYFTIVNYPQYNNVFTINGETYTFLANTGLSYNVEIAVTDGFGETAKSVILPTAAVIMHFKQNGKGIGLGKISEEDNTVDVGWKIDMNSQRIHNLPAPSSDNDAVNKKYADGLVAKTYPVGAIYMSTVSTSPASLFGGTWEQIKERFLYAANDESTKYKGNTMGGEEEHTLIVSEMPSHTHNFNANAPEWSWADGGSRFALAFNAGERSDLVLSEGGDDAHNNMPPYLTVYMWKRTA